MSTKYYQWKETIFVPGIHSCIFSRARVSIFDRIIIHFAQGNSSMVILVWKQDFCKMIETNWKMGKKNGWIYSTELTRDVGRHWNLLFMCRLDCSDRKWILYDFEMTFQQTFRAVLRKGGCKKYYNFAIYTYNFIIMLYI